MIGNVKIERTNTFNFELLCALHTDLGDVLTAKLSRDVEARRRIADADLLDRDAISVIDIGIGHAAYRCSSRMSKLWRSNQTANHQGERCYKKSELLLERGYLLMCDGKVGIARCLCC